MFACGGRFYVLFFLRTASYVTASASQRGAALPRGGLFIAVFACGRYFYVLSYLRTASYVTTSALQQGAALPRGA